VVVATNTPINDKVKIHTKQAPYLTYVIGARVPRGTVAHALLWDTLQPYHFVRVIPGQDPHGELLLVGGEDHKTGRSTTARSASTPSSAGCASAIRWRARSPIAGPGR
jgi:hypothetical protein